MSKTDLPTATENTCAKVPSEEETLAQVSYLKRIGLLILTFAKFGGITFGGGYSMIALLEEELVQKKGWMTQEEVLNIITVGESTPGPIAVNTATFVGYKLAGFSGGIIATLALVFPAWLIIVLISTCYLVLRENVWIAAALAGIRIAAIVLIVNAFLRMGHGIKLTASNLITGMLAFAFVAFDVISALWVILGALIFGVLWHGVRPRYLAKQKEEA